MSSDNAQVSKRGLSPSFNSLPLSLEGEGDNGDEGISYWAKNSKSKAKLGLLKIKQPKYKEEG